MTMSSQKSTFFLVIWSLLLFYNKISIVQCAVGDVQISPELKSEIEKMRELAKNNILHNLTSNDESLSFMDNFVEQIKIHCREKNAQSGDTFDFDQKELANNITLCMQEKFANHSVDGVFNEIEESIPEGDLDKVFSDMCTKKWPSIYECLGPTFGIMDKCWSELNLEALLANSVRFFCGDDNDGARIALFIAEGGLKCVETYSEEIRLCMEHHRPKDLTIDPEGEAFDAIEDFLKKKDMKETKQTLCQGLQDSHKCIGVLKRCEDSTPENLISSMLRQVAYTVKCEIIDQSQTGVSASSKITLLFPFLIFSTSFLLILLS